MARKAKKTITKNTVLDNNLKFIEDLKKSGVYQELNSAILERTDNLKPVLFKSLKNYIGTEQLGAYFLAEQLYCLPTPNVINTLKSKMKGYKKSDIIEIGAGNGLFSHILGIQGTDIYAQANADMKKYYLEMGQVPIKYRNKSILRMSDIDAVSRLKPKVVFATWVTDKSRLEFGVDMLSYFNYESVEKVIFIGNTHIHKTHEIVNVDFIDTKLCDTYNYTYTITILNNAISRSTDKGLDFMVTITRNMRSPLLNQSEKYIKLLIDCNTRVPLLTVMQELPYIGKMLVPHFVEKAQQILRNN
ncbi:MAG: hypothetical protein ACRCX2_34260 [Paraclostridium sp.]